MGVRAKFWVTGINHRHNHNTEGVNVELTLEAVYGDGKGNESWSKWTPSGKLTMTVTNPAAIEQFELGKSYYMDFTPAEA